MFEKLSNFFNKMTKPEVKELASKDAAKERLHLVLMQDRANVSVDFLELMKKEIIDVIKKYIVVDENAIDVRLTNQEKEDGTTGAPSLYANIPIINIKNEVKAEKIKDGTLIYENGELEKNNIKEEIIKLQEYDNTTIEENKIEDSINSTEVANIEVIELGEPQNIVVENITNENNETEHVELLEEIREEVNAIDENQEIVFDVEESSISKNQEEKIEPILDFAEDDEEEDDDDDVTFDDLLKKAEEEEAINNEHNIKDESSNSDIQISQKPIRSKKNAKNKKSRSN